MSSQDRSNNGSATRFSRIRGGGEPNDGLLGGAKKAWRSTAAALRFQAPSLLNRSNAAFSGIKRFGISKVEHYWKDPFHTLLNLPWGRFIVIFFLTYVMEFMVFAFIFWAMSDKCVIGKEGKFAHALWMSSRTASTLGYDAIHPNPDCVLVNLMVMTQVIASSLINFIMLGLVFARFSAPFKRASTIRFSSVMVCNRHPSGYWCVCLRVANIRKHQILKPSLRMVMTAVDSITPSNYIFEHLAIEGLNTQETNLELGFPANVMHVITPTSPLYNLSLLEMETRMMEILVFVDGIDAMTSKNMSARHAYNTNEVHMNEQFLPLHLEMRGKALGLDFSSFDQTALASTQLLTEYNADPALAERPLPEVQSHMWHLRHNTFKRLAERDQALGHGPAGAAAAAAARGGPAASSSAGAAAASPPAPGAGAAGLAAAAAGLGGVAGSPAGALHGGLGALRAAGGSGAVTPSHGASAAGAAPSHNPFAPSAAAANGLFADDGVRRSGGGAGGGAATGASSSWMGFGVTPTAPAPPGPAAHIPVPLSALLGSTLGGHGGGHTGGLSSFADMPTPHGYSTAAQRHHHAAPSQPLLAAQPLSTDDRLGGGVGPLGAGGLAGVGVGAGGVGGALELHPLPTSSHAGEHHHA